MAQTVDVKAKSLGRTIGGHTMGNRAFVRLLAVSTLVLPASAMAAGMPCGNTKDITRLLDQRYGEQRVSSGLGANGQVLQIYASARNRTWTAITTTAVGTSCVVATGSKWVDVDQPTTTAQRDTSKVSLR